MLIYNNLYVLWLAKAKKKSDFVLDFTKKEIEDIKSKIYLTELQEKILDMKLKGDLTEYGMALEKG